MLTLSNPAGLWALLGIPAVLAIHFLQRQSIILPVSTLFLLEKTQKESASGRKFDRLINSVPLWMQLLGVLLLTWLLVAPRYQRPKSTQRVAIVLDSSASMSVFKESLKTQLIEALPGFKGSAAALEITILESLPSSPKIYSGSSIPEISAAIEAWNPRSGATDPSQALRLARSLVSRDGAVIYATDTPPAELPYNATVFSAGEKIENAGFTGCSFENREGALIFKAIVRNYSDTPQVRQWQMEFADGRKSEPRTIELDPKSLVTIQAAFPPDATKVQLTLTPDRFTLDDTLPLVIPRPKPLSLFAATSGSFQDLAKRLLRSLEPVETAPTSLAADLTLLSYDPLDPQSTEGNAAIFVRDDTRGGNYLKGDIISEKHPLMDGLNWQSLLVRETIQLERRSTDTVMLWQGSRPLIFLREEPAANGGKRQQLCFNFDLRLSNATGQPAFIVLLHRFAETIRSAKVAAESLNLESGQPLHLAASAAKEAPAISIRETNLTSPRDGKTLTEPARARLQLEAPRNPGFLEISQGDQQLLNAAVQFADTREADFNECKAAPMPVISSPAVVERNTVEDYWWRAWFLLLITALLVSWQYSRNRESARSISPLAAEP